MAASRSQGQHRAHWFENLGKRQVKTPKIYFRDSGIYHRLMDITARKAHRTLIPTSSPAGVSTASRNGVLMMPSGPADSAHTARLGVFVAARFTA